MSSDDYKEQYQSSPRQLNGAVPGLDQFIEIATKASNFFKTKVDETYLKNFSLKAVKMIGPYPDKFRRALDYYLENMGGTFPSIYEFKDAVEKLPRRPIDHMAMQKVDARESGCGFCRYSGLVEMMKKDHILHAYCQCPLGVNLKGIGTDGIRTFKELENLGYQRRKKYKET